MRWLYFDIYLGFTLSLEVVVVEDLQIRSLRSLVKSLLVPNVYKICSTNLGVIV